MSDPVHGILLDLMSMHAICDEYGCGLDPHVLELLQDRQTALGGCLPCARDIRDDYPVQHAEASTVILREIPKETYHARG